MRRVGVCGIAALAAITQACASVPPAPAPSAVGAVLADRSGANTSALATPKTWTIPEGVSIDDGLTQDEAVAIALWNNADFHAALTQLGIARADLIEAGLIRNPILSLLFPLGPKQMEFTVSWPLEQLWQRPKRIADARLNADAVAQNLMANGLTLIANVRLAFADVTAADRALAVAAEQTQTAKQLADISGARLRAGDISEFESRLALTDATRIEAAGLTRRAARDTAMSQLRALLGLAVDAPALKLSPAATQSVNACGDMPALIKSALASRPEVRAAELHVEAAGERVGLEKNRIFTLTAILDANGEGKQGFEMGPGIGAELPVFSQNDGRRARAAAELEQASRRYVATRASVSAGVESAFATFRAVREAQQVFASDAGQSLARDRQQAQRLYDAGEISLLNLLETRQRLNEFEMTKLDAEAAAARAAIRLDEAVGRVCRER